MTTVSENQGEPLKVVLVGQKRVRCPLCDHYHPAVHQRDVCGYILSGGAFGAVICACPLVSNKPQET